ncbi:RAD57 protein [Pseudozyma hubeiensis SY62]|uniref:RAD57 protein n=1 Tax=Pseudozyma hubeiensis (strain SY62) TaxID=1305764 RepID=R9PID2_PSEHS|nr:RAD57 protein [Pseudozyma hubeiensis SY62]GAC97830.1 RAD57 protein [Pseudozyma hubeiensis SY62]
MTSLAIADVPWISKRIKACCRRAKLFSTDEILLAQPQQLQQALRISQADVDLLVLQVATASAPSPVSVLDALNGKRPPPKLDQDLFDTTAAADGNDAASTDGSDSDGSDDVSARNASFPSSSIVPPTQGYDGNFPGAERFLYDSDSGSDSDTHDDADAMMHDDVEPPSTFRRAHVQHIAADDSGHQEHSLNSDDDVGQIMITRDVLALGRGTHVFSSGSQDLDDLLNGGFRSAVLTEIVGESGSGKTQMAIQACTFAALGLVPLPPADNQSSDSLSAAATQRCMDEADTLQEILQGCGMDTSNCSRTGLGTCYITSGGERAAHSIVNRALELTSFAIKERFDRKHPSTAGDTQSSQDTDLERRALLARAQELGRERVLANLHVACVADIEALEHALRYSLPGLISRLSSRKAGPTTSSDVGLVVIDNLPSLFQEDAVAATDIDSLVQRSKMLVEIADSLKRIAAGQQPSAPRQGSQERAVLVLNHVSDAFGVDKEIARRFVFDSADRIRLHRSQTRRSDPSASSSEQQASSSSSYAGLYDQPLAMDVASQSAFVSGLLASVPPTLAEAIGARALDESRSSNDGPLYTLHPRTAQLGHTWTNLINVRLFLSKTRGRICLPREEGSSSTETVAESDGKKKMTMTTVRKAAVVMNPFGPTMLDTTGDKKAVRQLRFVITSGRAIHALDGYSSATLASDSTSQTTTDTMPSGSQAQQRPADRQHATQQHEQDEEDLFGEALEDHHWLAIDQIQSQVMTPS